MTKTFSSFEEIIADEHFLAWYRGTDPGKSRAWQEFIEQHPEYAPFVQEAIQCLNVLPREEELSNQLIEEQHLELIQKLESARIRKMNTGKKRWLIPAAAAILIAIAGFAIWNGDGDLKINTQYGEVSTHSLPDGSKVMLNANSKLSVGDIQIGEGDREVWLEGEAFFEVAKSTASNRFVVHAGKMDIIVTGTQFNAVNREGETSVLLKEGSVTIKTNDGKEIKMKPGEYVILQNEQPAIASAPEERILAWIQSKMVFENTSLIDAARSIENHYGVKIKVDEALQNQRITGILPNDNLDVLLKALEATMNFRIVRNEKEIIIQQFNR